MVVPLALESGELCTGQIILQPISLKSDRLLGRSMYLVDTNVISEARKSRQANPGVQKFFQSADAADIYICVQTIGEIRRGLENIRHRNELTQARRLEKWLDLVVADYVNRTLSFDEACAQVWGRLMSPHHAHPVDKQIAAIALIYDLTVVTRNVVDFRGTGVALKILFSNQFSQRISLAHRRMQLGPEKTDP